MLGSHFDLAQQIETIAARRDRAAKPTVDNARSASVGEDFDRRLAAFMDSVLPIRVRGVSSQGIAAPVDRRDLG